MPSLAGFTTDLKAEVARAIANTSGTFKVATTSPLTVYLDGNEGDDVEPVAAREVTGLTYSVGMTGDYFLRQGQQPLCLPTS